MQWLLSLIPWWLYAACAVVAYFAARHYLGEKAALVYAIAAVWWISYDKGGDDRETWLRAKAATENQHAIDRANDARGRSDAVVPGPDGMPDDGYRRD